ncbi:hypothetical protein [Paenibacillus konkukensis]
MSEKQIRLVGRVWEIRRYLKMAQQHLTTDVSLLAFLSQQTGHSHQRAGGLMLDGELTLPACSEGSTPYPPQRQSPQKTPDLRVIPFPSKQ